eukprot:COSAG02_NODE_25141_length_668_cov_0.513181_1_plen_125_part_10
MAVEHRVQSLARAGQFPLRRKRWRRPGVSEQGGAVVCPVAIWALVVLVNFHRWRQNPSRSQLRSNSRHRAIPLHCARKRSHLRWLCGQARILIFATTESKNKAGSVSSRRPHGALRYGAEGKIAS